jgi:putative effector of murein hydrolase LrgA (UPF0299 family)
MREFCLNLVLFFIPVVVTVLGLLRAQ